MRVGVIAAACGLLLSPLAAQDTTRTAQDSAVRVFLDCPDTFCDFDYYRTEITFVNWVRDRQFAQVHVLVTTQSTGGGQEYALAFIGLERFAGAVDTLRWTSKIGDSQDDIRRGLANTMRFGLIRFAARTPVARRLEISYNAPAQAAAQVHDPWKNWVFSINFFGNLNGEKRQKFQYWSGETSAERITDAWKIKVNLNQNYNQSDFTLTNVDSLGNPVDVKFRSISRGYDGNALVVRSLGPHWSVGGRSSFSSSTFLNQRFTAGITPAIEYDIYPYSHSTRRLLTLRYEIGVTSYRYRDTTIFNKLKEVRGRQALSVSLSVKQPWGNTSLSLVASNFLHDFRKNRLTLFASGQVRVYKGLSVRGAGDIALIHDQLSLSKAGATEQQVLLQRRQLATSYSYFAFFGFGYTFGSKFANIVNPRFEGGGGGFFFSQ